MSECTDIKVEDAFECGTDLSMCEGWLVDKISAFKNVLISFGTRFITKKKLKKLMDMILAKAESWTEYTGTAWDDVSIKVIKDGMDANWDKIFDLICQYLGAGVIVDNAIITDGTDESKPVTDEDGNQVYQIMCEGCTDQITAQSLCEQVAMTTSIDINTIVNIFTVFLKLVGLFF